MSVINTHFFTTFYHLRLGESQVQLHQTLLELFKLDFRLLESKDGLEV
jgi:hypothetical protein